MLLLIRWVFNTAWNRYVTDQMVDDVEAEMAAELARRRRSGVTEAERFELGYIPEPNSGCWLWVGTVRGSGRNSEVDRPVMRVKGKRTFASHVAWRLNNAPVPNGLSVLHRCDNPMCVNPAHLFLGTHFDNMRDMAAKGRAGAGKLTIDQVRLIRQTHKTLGKTHGELAKQFGVSRVSVTNIINRKVWAHLD